MRPERFVELALHRHARDHVLEDERAALFGEHGNVVRIPLGEDCALLDLLAVADVQERADHDVVGLEFLVLVVDDLDRAGLVQHDARAVGGRTRRRPLVLDHAARADADFRGLESAGRDATDVEGAHRELRAGFADRLRGDDADRVADLRDAVGRGIDAVGLRVDAVFAGRGERRHDLHALDADVVDLGGSFLGDEVAGADEELGRD